MFSKKLRQSALFGVRARLIFLFTALLTFVLCLYSVILIQMFVGKQERELDSAIYNLAIDMVSDINRSSEQTAQRYYRMLFTEDKIRPFALFRTLIQITTADGIERFRSKSLGRFSFPFPKQELAKLRDHRYFYRDIDSKDLPGAIVEGKHYRMLTYVISSPPHEKVILQIAAPQTLLDREAKSIVWFFALTIPFVVIAAAFGGWIVSQGALGPVRSITRKALFLTSRNLSERVPVPEARDEIRELAETLNGLLNRLENSFRSQEAFVANASHQLKTPLAVLRGEIDLMRHRFENDESSSEFLETLSYEVAYLTRLTEELLTLARLSGTPEWDLTASVALEEMLFESFPSLEKLALTRGQTLRVNLEPGESPHGFTVRGDAGLLQILEQNLIENALKYSPDGSVVSIDLRAMADAVRITVADEGDGVPPEDRDRIFERFYRGKGQKNFDGTGLGLAIAKEITLLHRGQIEVENQANRGATFHATIPRIRNL